MNGLSARLATAADSTFPMDVEISVPGGSAVALVGPNGAGKSTVVDMLAGTRVPDRGRIELNGRVLYDEAASVFVPPEERRVGVMFQGGLLFPRMSVLDNVSFGIRARGARRSDAENRAQEWLDGLEIGHLADRRADRLSGGESQLVALARAVATDPELLILDEPLSALDVAARPRVRRAISMLLGEFAGATIVISHDPTEAFLLADTIVVMEEGRTVQAGPVESLRMHPTSQYVADLVGINYASGIASRGVVDVGGQQLASSDLESAGPVVALIHPRVVSLHAERPEGSARNVWQSLVAHVEPVGDVVRVVLDGPIPLTAEVTPAGAAAARARQGGSVWVSIKATEVALRKTGER